MLPDSDSVPLQSTAESNWQHRATERPKGQDPVLPGATSLQLCVGGSNSHCLTLGFPPWGSTFALPPTRHFFARSKEEKLLRWGHTPVILENLTEGRWGVGRRLKLKSRMVSSRPA